MLSEPSLVTFVPYRSASGLPVETISLDAIRRKGGTAHLRAVQRPEFVMFLLYTAGNGHHIVDFERYVVSPGTLIVVRSGCTHQFCLTDTMQGQALVVDHRFMMPSQISQLRDVLSNFDLRTCSVLTPDAQADFLETCRLLQSDSARFGGHPLIQALLRERLYVWLVLMHVHWSALPETGASALTARFGLLREFRLLIEAHYLARWSVADYARKLGFAERTLTRACLRAEGQSAKAVIDARLLLEIRRWLAHSENTLDEIAHQLDFGDASNLVQFFRRLDGRTPSTFRAAYRNATHPNGPMS